MRYFLPHCRKKQNFIECANLQLRDHYRYTGPADYTTEVAISLNHPLPFKGSKILLVGAGPSTVDCDWDHREYDYIFSCNHFFLSERLQGIKIDFATICPEVNVFSKEFNDYLNNSSTLFCIENVDVQHDKIDFLWKKNRLCYSSIRMHLKELGTMGKLIILASYFQPRELHVVGLDGTPKGGFNKGDEAMHSFQKGKRMFRNINYEKCLGEFNTLWNYLLNDIGRNIKYKNLGHGHPCNMSTEFNII